MQRKNKNFNVPNTLTVLRMVLVIPFMCLYLSGQVEAAIVVLVVAGLTDMLDGFVARHFHQYTELGQMLDPLSDKITQGAVAISLAIRHTVLLPVLLVFIVKEALMLVGGSVLLKNHKRPCAAKWYGKLATVLFYIAFAATLCADVFFHGNGPVLLLAVTLLIITAAVMLFALVMYAREFCRIMKSTDPADQIDLAEVMDKKKRLGSE